MEDLDSIGTSVNWNKLLEEEDTATTTIVVDNTSLLGRSNANTPTGANPLNYERGPNSHHEGSFASSHSERSNPNSIVWRTNHSDCASEDPNTTPSLRGPTLVIPSTDGRSCRFTMAQTIPNVHALTTPDTTRYPALLQGSAGIFIGQIPITYSTDDLRNMLVALAAEKGVRAEVKEIKIHPRNTCAFVLVNRAALKPIVSYSKLVLCDATCIWVGETTEAGAQLAELAALTHAGQAGRTMLGVPKTTMVMEACSRSRRPRMDGGVSTTTEGTPAPSYLSVFPGAPQQQAMPPSTPQYHHPPMAVIQPSSSALGFSMSPQQQYNAAMAVSGQNTQHQSLPQSSYPQMQYAQYYSPSPQMVQMAPPSQQHHQILPQQQYQLSSGPTTYPTHHMSPAPVTNAAMYHPAMYAPHHQHPSMGHQPQQQACVPMVDPTTGSVVLVPVQAYQQQLATTLYY